mgnify:CR=1 FL=1
MVEFDRSRIGLFRNLCPTVAVFQRTRVVTDGKGVDDGRRDQGIRVVQQRQRLVRVQC